jgi:hypothetical protein
MQISFGTRWLVLSACLFTTACTEKTIINEAPQSSDASDLTLSDTTGSLATEPDGALTGSEFTDSAEQAQGIPGAPEPVIVTPTPNMVEAITVADSQTTTPAANMVGLESTSETDSLTTTTQEDSQTTSETEIVDQISDTSTTDSLTNIPAAEQSTTDTESTTADNQTSVDDATNSVVDDSISTDDDALLADPTTPATVIPDTTTNTTLDPAVTGSPGMNVDCQLLLPCRWLSEDTQFAATITNADNIGEQGRLAIEYSILTSHDTAVNIAGTDPAIDASGLSYLPAALRLGEVTGGQSQSLVAGSAINATIEFSEAATANSLSSWTIALSDSGLLRQPVFTSIPVGTITRQHADCTFTLPCAWVSPSNDVTITLLAVNSLGSSNRLTANFKVEITRNATVAVDAGSIAKGTDGMDYEGRTHSIGVETSAEKITNNVAPGTQLNGTIFFHRTQAMSEALQQLSIIVYEDEPTPRWNPSFLSVPIE